MRKFRNLGLLVATALLLAWPAASQMPQMRIPDFKGVFNPMVGSGAVYQDESKTGKNEMEVTIVGKEANGYWMEMVFQGGQGQMVMKNLITVNGDVATFTRSIMQMPGMQPMEITSMMQGNRQPPPQMDSRKQAMLVGSESVTTPAGTFDCQHYRGNDGSWDAWLSNKVSPWGLVKATNKSAQGDSTTLLIRMISNATDRITGTPQQMNMQDMMRQMQQRRGQ